MTNEKEYRTLLEPVLARYPEWHYRRHWVFCRPIGFYLRGCMFNGSFSAKGKPQVLHCVFPLFEAPRRAHISWGIEYPVPGTTNFGWDLKSSNFVDKMSEFMQRVVIPKTSNVTNGEAFLTYLDGHPACSGWIGWARALGYVHMGDLAKAEELIAPLVKDMLTDHPRLAADGAWGQSMIEMLRLIRDDPNTIPKHCEAIAQKSVTLNKLEKYWEPTSFIATPDPKRR
jgi:hypothetical protein